MKRIVPSTFGLDRAREDLAVGEVLATVARHPRPPLDAQREIRALADHANLPAFPEPGRELGVQAAEDLPLGARIVPVEQARLEDEVFVLGERHVRVLRGRLRRVERHD